MAPISFKYLRRSRDARVALQEGAALGIDWPSKSIEQLSPLYWDSIFVHTQLYMASKCDEEDSIIYADLSFIPCRWV